jgi:uncharacterized protein YutD
MAMLSLKALLGEMVTKISFGTSRWNIKGRSQSIKFLRTEISDYCFFGTAYFCQPFMD